MAATAAFGGVLGTVLVIGLAAQWLLTLPARAEPPRATIFPTPDPLMHAAIASIATFYAPTPTSTPTPLPASTPEPTVDPTQAAALTPHPTIYCGTRLAVVGQPCKVPEPPT